jgi:hypothetical protein
MKASQVRRNASRLVLLLGLSVTAAGFAAVGGRGWVAGNGTVRYGGLARGPAQLPRGALLQMPHAARQYALHGHPYYWYAGGWYAPAYGPELYFYPVIEPAPGVVGSVPMPYSVLRTPYGILYVSNGVYYQPFMYQNTVWYRIVPGP